MTVKYIKSRQDIDTKYIYFIYRHTRTHTRSVRMCVRVSVMCWRRIKWKTKSHNHEHVNKLFNANGKVASFWCVWISLCLSACVFYVWTCLLYDSIFIWKWKEKQEIWFYYWCWRFASCSYFRCVLCRHIFCGDFSLYFIYMRFM